MTKDRSAGWRSPSAPAAEISWRYLRRAGFVAVAAAVVASGCDKGGGSNDTPARRSESIAAADGMPTAETSASAPAPKAHEAPAAAPRKLCDGELSRPGKKLPKGSFTSVSAAGASRLSNKLSTGGGRWTWINFFAAWCGPCKEEIPRLRGFQAKLASDLDVAFVSLDDDRRQLTKFLGDQPESGVRAALWLEPASRTSWLSALGMKDPPDLPAHVLVDPDGKVRCIVGGAVVDDDFATIKAIVHR